MTDHSTPLSPVPADPASPAVPAAAGPAVPHGRYVVPGSERLPVAGATVTGPAWPDERIEVTLRLRGRPGPAAQATGAVGDDRLPAQRRYLSREAYAAAHGADPLDIARVAAFAGAHRLAMVDSSAARRSVVLSGTAATLAPAFGVTLQQFQHDGGTYRGRVGVVTVPADLAGIVEAVFGLDDRPQALPHFQIGAVEGGGAGPRAAAAAAAAFTPPQLGALYQFPPGLDGHGQCIAIIELGGGFRPADLSAYFTGLGQPVPAVKAISVDGGRNRPGNADSADGEVMLDIEVAAALAPGAAIAVYFAPNTNKGFLDAITTAVHDAVNRPSVLSISWGAPESQWTVQAMTQFDEAFQAAAAMGVTVCCAAGDAGSSDGAADGRPHVDFPASSPWALGCGGTRLAARGTAIESEVVWNAGATTSATGGGVSGHFGLPAWQAKAGVPALAGTAGSAGFKGRGVPDVAGNADPATGYRVRVDGSALVIGGTSAVAPLWAALVARLNQGLGHPVGHLNPLLYGSAAVRAGCRDIASGDNGSYHAAAGWDPCTGWGSPIGTRLLAALRG